MDTGWIGHVCVDLESESRGSVTEEGLGGSDGGTGCEEQGSVDTAEVMDAAMRDAGSVAEGAVEVGQVIAADWLPCPRGEQELVSVTSLLETALDELLRELREWDGAEGRSSLGWADVGRAIDPGDGLADCEVGAGDVAGAEPEYLADTEASEEGEGEGVGMVC